MEYTQHAENKLVMLFSQFEVSTTTLECERSYGSKKYQSPCRNNDMIRQFKPLREDCGVIYVATGEKFHDELRSSLRSLRDKNPDLPVVVFSDAMVQLETDHLEIRLIERPLFTVEDKSACLMLTPFEKTLYLDTDTYITDVLDDIFEVLDRFDICMTHETARGYWYQDHPDVADWGYPPRSFPDVNTGVVAYKIASNAGRVINEWPVKYQEMKSYFEALPTSWERNYDQVSFRQLLWESPDVRIHILPTEYNALRYWGTYLWGKAVIVHGRGKVAKISDQMNEVTAMQRVHLQGLGTWVPFRQSTLRQLGSYYWRFHAELIASLWFLVKRNLKGSSETLEVSIGVPELISNSPHSHPIIEASEK